MPTVATIYAVADQVLRAAKLIDPTVTAVEFLASAGDLRAGYRLVTFPDGMLFGVTAGGVPISAITAAALILADFSNPPCRARIDTPQEAAVRAAVDATIADMDLFLGLGALATTVQVRTAALSMAQSMKVVMNYLKSAIPPVS